MKLRNFKAFQELTLDLGPLTLLTGVNCAGKSTVLQSLLLLQQSRLAGELEHGRLLLNGAFVQLGQVKDVLPESAEGNQLAISLSWTEQENPSPSHSENPAAVHSGQTLVSSCWTVDFCASGTTAEDRSMSLGFPTEMVGSVHTLLSSSRMRYVSAERLGPRRFSALADQDMLQQRQLDPTGETALHFLNHHRGLEVESALCLKPEHGTQDDPSSSEGTEPEGLDRRLITQCERWLSLIVPGLRLKLEELAALDLIQTSFQFSGKLGWSRLHRPTNVGFGVSYVLPVVLAILASKPGELVLLENPEAHLHPGAQYALGALLTQAAASGIQLLVETHSDHILNSIRVQVRNSALDAKDVKVHFFFRDPHDFHQFKVESPELKANGKLSDWPRGFFDQWDLALHELLRPMVKRAP